MTKSDIIELLVDLFSEVKGTFKVKLLNKPQTNNWDQMFIRPVENYVEFGQTGPIRISEVEWLDINPIEQIRIGVRVPDKYQDHTDLIKNFCDKHLIKYTFNDKIIRVIFAGQYPNT